MGNVSTREAAKKLGVSPIALSRYISRGKVPAPQVVKLGRFTVHIWTEREIEHVRKLLPKIANGRKTRWQRQRAAGKKKAKAKAPARVPVPHKQKSEKKK